MTAPRLVDTARRLVAAGNGLLALDEGNPTGTNGVVQLIITTAALADGISGAILDDEAIRQQTKDGTPFIRILTAAGIVPGTKADTGAKDLAARH